MVVEMAAAMMEVGSVEAAVSKEADMLGEAVVRAVDEQAVVGLVAAKAVVMVAVKKVVLAMEEAVTEEEAMVAAMGVAELAAAEAAVLAMTESVREVAEMVAQMVVVVLAASKEAVLMVAAWAAEQLVAAVMVAVL